MNMTIQNEHLEQVVQDQLSLVLHHLYINPLEKCNLKCKICYTRKTDPILSAEVILDFVKRYEHVHKLQTITFCGGEVFALAYFPELINELTTKGIFIQVITNGTINKLSELNKPNLINVIVSLDGLPAYHDANRGEGNFSKSINFLKQARQKGFHFEVFSIITRQNLPYIDQFEQHLYAELGETQVTYHPRKPPAYLMHHPVSNIVGEVNGFDFLEPEEMLKVMKERNVFPPPQLGCYQIALASTGNVFGCCEGVTPIGKISDHIEILFENLRQRLVLWQKTNNLRNCLGCSQPDFMCGIKKYLELLQ